MAAGRPRQFDENNVLDVAMRHFWREGYANSRLVDIAKEAGITKPSLYLAFGEKDLLFRRVLEHYGTVYGERVLSAFNAESNLAQAFAAYFREVAKILCDAETPNGCLRVNTIGELAEANPTLAEIACKQRSKKRAKLAQRLEAEDYDPQTALDLADMAVTISDGMAMAARSGCSKVQLHRTAKQAAKGFVALLEMGKQGCLTQLNAT